MCTSSKEFELEKQLHEQYAINNNANISSFVSFVVAILTLFGLFGYSFIFSSNQFSIKGNMIIKGILTLDAFFLFSLIVLGMLFFLALISLHFGYTNRSNQIIIDRIRDKYFGENKKLIFNKSYSPLNKTWINFLQGYFDLFFWLFFSGQIIVIFFSILKMIQNTQLDNPKLSYWSIFVFLIFIIQFGSAFLTLCFRSRYYVKYANAFEKKITDKMLKNSCFLTKNKFCKIKK